MGPWGHSVPVSNPDVEVLQETIRVAIWRLDQASAWIESSPALALDTFDRAGGTLARARVLIERIHDERYTDATG